jgi:hypothetical protein
MIFNTNQKIYKHDDYEIVYTKISSLKNVKNWNKNRPADMARIEQIKQHFKNNDVKLVPGIICIWNSPGGPVVYDGLHRFMAANEAMYCIVKKHNGTEADIICDFENINMGISLPMLYLEENNKLKKTVCENVVNKLCEKYPEFVSPSRNPQKQNFNRDIMVDVVSKVNVDFTKNKMDDIIFQELLLLNYKATDYIVSKKISTPKKCQQYGFYLCYLSMDYIINTIESQCVLKN